MKWRKKPKRSIDVEEKALVWQLFSKKGLFLFFFLNSLLWLQTRKVI